MDSSALFWLNATILAGTVMAEALVLWRVRLAWLDTSMIVISIAYTVSFAARLFFRGGSLNLLTNCAGYLIWAILFFFVFEMKRVENKLSSDSFDEDIRRNSRFSAEKIVFYSIFVGVCTIPIWVFYILKMADVPFNPRHFDIVFIISTSVCLICHLYMHIQFGLRLRYFLVYRMTRSMLTAHN